MLDRNYIFKDDFDRMFAELTDISKRLMGLITYLKNSELKGDKFHEPETPYGLPDSEPWTLNLEP